MNQRLTTVFLCAGLSAAAQAEDLLPLQKDNTWSLRNGAGASATFLVQDVVRSRDRKLARIHFRDNDSEHHWILFQDASGVSLAGFTLNGTDHYFNEPSPFLPANGADGQVWTGAVTTVVQMVSGISFRTPAGQARNGTEYQIEFVTGLKQRWILVPGIGFAAGGETEQRLLLQNYRLMPALRETNTPACPRIGISSIPMSERLNSSDRDAALAPVIGIGANVLSVSIGWNELEPEAFQYSAGRLRDELRLAAGYDISTVLNIRPIDNVRDLRPPDLADKPWDDRETLVRFAAALDHILDGLPPQVRWINLGYEVDPYFIERPEDALPFVRFFQFAAEFTRQKTGVSVGMVFSFDVTRGYSDIFRLFEQHCDHVAFNYYALKAGTGYAHRSANSPALDTLIMRSLAGGREILIPEAGYSSHPAVGGGPDAQAAFFSALFANVQDGRFAAVNVWSLFDLPDSTVAEVQRTYRIEHISGSGEFLSALGLLTVEGAAKPSFGSVAAELLRPGRCN